LRVRPVAALAQAAASVPRPAIAALGMVGPASVTYGEDFSGRAAICAASVAKRLGATRKRCAPG
jgi:hypothetical protein